MKKTARPGRMAIVFMLAMTMAGVAEEQTAFPESAENLAAALHPRATIGEYPEIFRPAYEKKNVLSGRQAAAWALARLKNRGLKNIRICEVHWLAAPLGGYLVDGLGAFRCGSKSYSLFRIGVADGSDADSGEFYRAGNEFCFIARGLDASGLPQWFPEPGPDYIPKPDEVTTEGVLAFEFLLGRERFETLEKRYQ